MLLALIAYAVASGIVLLWTSLGSSRAPEPLAPSVADWRESSVGHAVPSEWASAMLRRFSARLLCRAAAASRGTGQRASRIAELRAITETGPTGRTGRATIDPQLFTVREAQLTS